MFRVNKILIYYTIALMLFLTLGCGKKTAKEAINAGKPVTVILDKLDAEVGAITIRSTFEVQLKNGKFVATGIPKGKTFPETNSYALKESGNPNRISIWGAEFEYDSKNNVLLNNKIVGRLVLK